MRGTAAKSSVGETRRLHPVAVVGVAFAALLACVPAATASTSVSIVGSTLTVVADDKHNVVAVSDPGGGNYGVTDTGAGATVAVGAGCASDGSGGALCPTAGMTT